MITQISLKKLFDYNPDTGEFIYLSDSINNGKCKKGDIAGTFNDRYVKIRIDGKQYYAHRLAWFYMTGEWPEFIDHINQDKHDNRWINLRIVTKSQNASNTKKYVNNTSGVMGVTWLKEKKRWRSRITVNGKVISLGTYIAKEKAISVRKMAELLYGFHLNHGASA